MKKTVKIFGILGIILSFQACSSADKETTTVNNGTEINKETISVSDKNSVRVYVKGSESRFVNEGTINVSNGGIGVLTNDGGLAENKGTINVTDNNSIGMLAYGESTITNQKSGIINVTDGIGMAVGKDATLNNYGTINVSGSGIGIYGNGTINNSGDINVEDWRGEDMDYSLLEEGTINVDINGNVTINHGYISTGGALSVDGALKLNGASVDITAGKPAFEATSITGEIKILPNFALTENGYEYNVDNLLSATSSEEESKVTADISPLWISNIDVNGDLTIKKKDYVTVTAGNQFDNLDKGLDYILRKGSLSDKEVLKNMNYYLSTLSADEYKKESERVLGATRGDVYSTIQARMNTINDVFNSSFSDLEKLSNEAKDSGKYGAIYSSGKFEDSTDGIDDYDYKVTGLMYLNENEKIEDKTKIGYSIGFAVSEFKFKDSGSSKEDVYSLRGGIHRNKKLENELNWLTQLTGSVNYHKTDRKLALGYDTLKNKGEYQTYSLEISNKLTKDLYKGENKEAKLYSALSVKYGILDSFKEEGDLVLELDENDYYSVKPEIGVSGEYRKHIKNNRSIGLFGNIGLAYELGEVYEGNKARLKDGGQGYYSLITPEKEKGSLVLKAGTKYGKLSSYNIILETEGNFAENKDKVEMKYSLKLNYTF
ncbi:MAG: autotransporter domain-containing protein [Fusobacteriaceae bacterium]